MTQPTYVGRYPAARLLLLVVAVILFVIYGLVSLGTLTSAHANAFLGFGLAAFAAAFL